MGQCPIRANVQGSELGYGILCSFGFEDRSLEPYSCNTADLCDIWLRGCDTRRAEIFDARICDSVCSSIVRGLEAELTGSAFQAQLDKAGRAVIGPFADTALFLLDYVDDVLGKHIFSGVQRSGSACNVS